MYDDFTANLIKENSNLKLQLQETKEALFDMVWQYCSSNGKLYHSFMSCEELAFSVLNLENGMSFQKAENIVLNKVRK